MSTLTITPCVGCDEPFVKDPDAILDYEWRWGQWLAGDTIVTATFTVNPPAPEPPDPPDPSWLAVDSSSVNAEGTTATAWISGGALRRTYGVTCRVTTTGGRTADWTLDFTIQSK